MTCSVMAQETGGGGFGCGVEDTAKGLNWKQVGKPLLNLKKMLSTAWDAPPSFFSTLSGCNA